MTVTVNGRGNDVAPGTTVADLISQLGARPTGTAVAINGEVVPRSAWTHQRIADGDALEVLAAVQGGCP
jgi:sulfur carrier protein